MPSDIQLFEAFLIRVSSEIESIADYIDDQKINQRLYAIEDLLHQLIKDLSRSTCETQIFSTQDPSQDPQPESPGRPL